MNKREYKQILIYRKNQELLLFNIFKSLSDNKDRITDTIYYFGIPRERVEYIVKKWIRKGYFIDDGDTIFRGRLTVEEIY